MGLKGSHMMRQLKRANFGVCCAAIVHGCLLSDSLAGELTPAKFHELHTRLRPAPEEPWRTIPWQISLLDAQRIAARERKPIFIWAMDGHPLGCT